MSIVYTTIYYPDIRNLNIYLIIARPYPLLDEEDYNRGYVRKADLWAVTSSYPPKNRLSVYIWSTIIEYRVTTYENCITEWEQTKKYQVF